MAAAADTNGREGNGVLRIGLFFDGTRNNAHNRAARAQRQRPAPEALPPAVRAEDDSPYQSRVASSYDNGLTNIARLHGLYADARRDRDHPLCLAVYIEGAGTRNDQPDDLVGLAFGVGASGVRAKVERALGEALDEALSALSRTAPPPIRAVRVDLFGFSRGAAAARDAANRLHAWSTAQWQGRLREAGLPVSPAFALPTPCVAFIGLFDTVLSIADGRERRALDLRLARGVADTVLHLVARDEHRAHFALVSAAPPHEEIALPGVHANIGGGYDQPVEGPKLLTRPVHQRLLRYPFPAYSVPPQAWLQATRVHQQTEQQAQHWRARLGLGPDALWVDSWHQWQQQRIAGADSVLPSPVLRVYAAVVLKRAIDWRYQLVALRLMHARAAQAGVPWATAPDDHPALALPRELQAVARRLLAGQPLLPVQDALLRRRYLGQSAHWNFDALGDTQLAYAADDSVSALPYRPGPGLFYINRPTEDGLRVVLDNA